MPELKVSVIVPTFRQAEYISETLDGILLQEGVQPEVVVVHLPSGDGTENVLERYKGRITVAEQFGRGVPEALNQGVALCANEWISYITSDNIPSPDMFLRLLENANGKDLVYGDHLWMDHTMSRVLRKTLQSDYDFDRVFCDTQNWGITLHSCFVYKKDLHLNVGLYDPEYRHAHDNDMFFRFAAAGARIKYVPGPYINIRTHLGERQIDQNSPSGMARLAQETKIIIQRALAWRAANVKKGEKPGEELERMMEKVGSSGAVTVDTIDAIADKVAKLEWNLDTAGAIMPALYMMVSSGYADRAAALVPTNALGLHFSLRLGWFFDRIGDTSRAAQMFRRVLEDDPDRVEAAEFLWLYGKTGLDPTGPHALPIDIHGHTVESSLIEELKTAGIKKVFMVGHGMVALEATALFLQAGIEVPGYLDLRPGEAWGCFLGKPIKTPGREASKADVFVLTAERRYHPEMEKTLRDAGVAGTIFKV